MDVYKKLQELGLTLPPPPPQGGLYTPAKPFGEGYYYISGCGPVLGEGTIAGRLGAEFTVEQGQGLARDCMLNVLAVLEAAVGDLNKVRCAVKILTMVNSANDFFEQPQVANGGSQLLGDLFGMDRLPARSAIGVNVLPGNIPVETEAIFEVE